MGWAGYVHSRGRSATPVQEHGGVVSDKQGDCEMFRKRWRKTENETADTREYLQSPFTLVSEFACSPRVGVGFLEVPSFPPTTKTKVMLGDSVTCSSSSFLFFVVAQHNDGCSYLGAWWKTNLFSDRNGHLMHLLLPKVRVRYFLWCDRIKRSHSVLCVSL